MQVYIFFLLTVKEGVKLFKMYLHGRCLCDCLIWEICPSFVVSCVFKCGLHLQISPWAGSKHFDCELLIQIIWNESFLTHIMSAQRIYLLASVILSLGPRLGRFEQMLPHNPYIHLNLCNESMKQNERSLVLRCMFHIHAFLSHFWVTDELRFTEFQMGFERKAEYTLNWSPASHRECFGEGKKIPPKQKCVFNEHVCIFLGI